MGRSQHTTPRALLIHELLRLMASINAQTRTRAVTPVMLSDAIQWDMRSEESGRTYRIYVRTPMKPPPRSGYPTIYFTDGNITFPIAAMLAELFEVEPNCEAPLVVGIGYPVQHWAEEVGVLRVTDLTSSRPGNRMFEEFFETRPDIAYGGSNDFYRFLTRELQPEIASMYRTDADNCTLYGHSLGGCPRTCGWRQPGSDRQGGVGSRSGARRDAA